MVFKQSVSLATLVAAGVLAVHPAWAQSAPNTSPSNVNVLNLLSPYLDLNATTVGKTTLTDNLNKAIATNNGASPTLQALGESDENLLGSISNTLRTAPAGGTTATTFGIAANLGGGLPTQAVPAGGTIAPMQPVGGLGVVLGKAYVAGVSPTGGTLTAVETLLNNAYNNFTSKDLGVAKAYFSDGSYNNTSNGTTAASGAKTAIPAVAPTGYTLPTANGLPNPANSVYDLAYGVTNTQSGQDVYGSSRPVQVSTKINSFDPTALSGLATNPSFPSGHTTYAYTDSILLGMLVPQEYQSMLYRASAYANSRIVVGVHYPLDIIGSRALATYDLSQAFTNAAYQNGSATTVPSGTADVVNLPANFLAASAQITPYLTTAATTAGCGTTIAACATSAANTANDPYAVSAAAAATYTANLTYGLPTLTFAQAPREAAPAGGPDASILLAPLYGGSTSAAKTIEPNGGIDGNLSTTTINQIIVNTETNALAAFYGTSLSYWTRIDLASAAGYFNGVTGTLSLQPTDVVTTNVTIDAGGVLAANGTITGTTTVAAQGRLAGSGTVAAVTVADGGALAPGSLAAQNALRLGHKNVADLKLTLNGALALNSGATLAIFASPSQATKVAVTGTASVGGAKVRVTTGTGNYLLGTDYTILTATGGVTGRFAGASTSDTPFLMPRLAYAPDAVSMSFAPNRTAFLGAAGTANEAAVAQGILNGAGASAANPVVTAALNLSSAAQARSAFDALSGEGITAAQNIAQRSAQLFTSSIFDQTTFYGSANSITLAERPPIRELADLPARAIEPVAPITPNRTWRAWASGFGGVEDIHANATLGSAAQQNTIYGGVVGVDYQLTPNYLLGVAVGGSDGDFSVPGRATSGSTTGGHLAVYDLATFGAFYGASSSSFSYFDNRATRSVSGFGGLATETERGNFDSHEFRTRLEFGRHVDGFGGVLTPFVAMEIAELRSNGFGETAISGPGLFRLNVQGQSAASVPTFVGARLQSTTSLGNGVAITPILQAAWVHEFAPYRSQFAAIADLPGSTFLVDGASPARDAAQIKVGAELAIGPQSVIFANFDGELSGVNQLYAGKGGFRYTW